MSGAKRWDADERTRSQTRAVLMAISRDRAWYFIVSIPWTLVAGVATLGLLPLLDAARRFDRWRRLEWIQYGEVMSWIADRTGDAEATALAGEADAAAGTASSRFAARSTAVAALAMLAWSAVFGGVHGLLATALWPVLLPTSGSAFALVLVVGWTLHLREVGRHRAWVGRWLACASDVLEVHDKRPVRNEAAPLPWPWLLSAAVLAGLGLIWIGAQVAVLASQNRYIRSTRAARMRFVERMLEWMDSGGLPMEFDVEALKPEEIAARLM